MLTLFARIRGLRSVDNLIDREIEKLAEFVDLTQYLDRSGQKVKIFQYHVTSQAVWSVLRG